MSSANQNAVIALPGSANRLAFAAILVIVALLIQQIALWWLYYHDGGKTLIGDEVYYMQTARSILGGGAWHSSTIWPPGQGLLIAAASANLLLVQIIQMLLFFGCAALLWLIWHRCSANALAASLAAGLFLLNPSDAAYAQYLWPEIPHLFALLLATYLLLLRPRSPAVAGAAGLAVALALMFKSLLTGFWPLLLLCFVTSLRPLRVHWPAAFAFVFALGVGVAPALIAGHRNSGHWSIADSSTFNLLAGLSDRARNDYVDEPVGPLFNAYQHSAATVDGRNAWARAQVQQLLEKNTLSDVLVQQFGRQYFRLFENKTLLLTQMRGPACAGYLGAYTPASPAIASTLRYSADIFHIFILCGFALGLALWRDWRRPWLWLALAFLGYQLALYLGLHVKARYLLPMLPVFCGFAGEVFAAALRQSGSTLVLTRTRACIGVLFAIVLLIFAFAGPWLDRYWAC